MIRETQGRPAAASDELEIVSFHLDGALLGIPIAQVEEVNHQLDLTPVPHAPACVRGVVNLRGDVVTVIDLRAALGLPPAALTRKSRNIVVRWRGERIGILVDRIGDVLRIGGGEITPPPANAAGIERRFFAGVCKLEGSLLPILDTEAILAGEQTLASP